MTAKSIVRTSVYANLRSMRTVQRQPNAAKQLASAINQVVGVPGKIMGELDSRFASLTAGIAQLFPALPAATIGSMALGLPHAHIAHPPSGPPVVPPLMLPPLGPVLLGTSISVLINGLPAARCGDIGLNPTCCGLPPMFEVFTGSSSVFIGGARAARVLDVTYHCKPTPPAGAAGRAARSVAQVAMKVVSKAARVAGSVAQVAAIAGDAIDAEAAEDPAVAEALALSAKMGAAQMAADAAAMAAGAAMGKDPCVPAGTLGSIVTGSSNVLIGGFPMPSWTTISHGLMRLAKGLAKRGGRSGGRSAQGKNH